MSKRLGGIIIGCKDKKKLFMAFKRVSNIVVRTTSFRNRHVLIYCSCCCRFVARDLLNNLNASKPSKHLPSQGKKCQNV